MQLKLATCLHYVLIPHILRGCSHGQRKLQVDIEQAGSQIIDRVAELDQASTRLERQRHKVETSKGKLEVLADKLSSHQEVLKRRENEFLAQVLS